MKRYRVELSPEALTHAELIDAWWIVNRPAAPTLFLDELEAAIRQLEATPHIELPAARRLLMPRTRYHVYYAIEDDDSVVRIHAVWHTSRGHGPRLG